MLLLSLIPLALLLLLGLARRALEPECPNCAVKRWSAHSTQLQCAGCGWSSGQPLQRAHRAPAVADHPQYEMCF